ncbi:MAG: autotransporter-associated beta strand repeat-containing protein [Kiritimatiellia bacterium]
MFCALSLGALHAEVIDLNGSPLTITNVADLNADGYTSETEATLTLILDDDVTAPAISGAIKLVKLGSGTLTFDAAQEYTGGTLVSGGSIAVESADWLGGEGGTITLEGGGIDFVGTDALTVSRAMTITPGSTGTIRRPAGSATLKLVTYAVVFKGATLKLERGGDEGTAYIKFERVNSSQFSGNGNATGGTLSVGAGVVVDLSEGDVIGGAGTQLDFTLRVCEGGVVTAYNAHSPLGPKVVLEGGSRLTATSLRSPDSTTGIENLFNTSTWKNFDFCRKVTVVPGSLTGAAKAIVDAPCIHLATTAEGICAEFEVAADAELFIDSTLWPNYGGKSRWIRKYGQGTLTLGRPLSNNGVIQVEEGTLRLDNKTYLGNAKLKVVPGARVELADGTILTDEFDSLSPGGFLSSAEVWFDATRIDAVADGTTLSMTPNLGSAHGVFGPFPYGSSSQPTYAASAINGRPALYFSGTGYYLGYTNKTDQITVFIVMKWDGWPEEVSAGEHHKWHGPYSMVPLYREGYTGEDYSTPGVLYPSWGTSFTTEFTYRYPNGTDMLYAAFDGADTLTGTETLISGFSRRGNAFSASTWTSDERSSDFKTSVASKSYVNYNIEALSLGGRVVYDNPAGYARLNPNRALKGWIGEFIVFSRCLDDDEMGFVQRYLQRKWGDSAQEAIAEPEVESRFTDIFLTVADADTAAANLKNGGTSENGHRVVKEGTGRCTFVGTHSAARRVQVKEGEVVVSAKSGATCGAAIWLDASDASTVTRNDAGEVVRVANKGNFGGAFVQNTSKKSNAPSLTPVPKLGQIGSLDALDFDGNSCLALREFKPAVDSRRVLCIFGAMTRDSYVHEGGKGRWGGPFSLYLSSNTEDDNGVSGDVNFHWEEGQGTYSMKVDGDLVADIPNGAPYVFSTWQEYNNKNYQFDYLDGETLTNAFKMVRNNTAYASVPALKYDVVNLGGRATGDGAPQWYGMDNGNNRLWDGKIGEFIVLDRSPAQSDVIAIVSYLREKWINGNSAAEPPAFLTGGTGADPAPGAEADWEFGADATLELPDEALAFGQVAFADGADVVLPETVSAADGLLTAAEVAFGGTVNLVVPQVPATEVKVMTAAETTGNAVWNLSGHANVAGWTVRHSGTDYILGRRSLLVIIR